MGRLATPELLLCAAVTCLTLSLTTALLEMGSVIPYGVLTAAIPIVLAGAWVHLTKMFLVASWSTAAHRPPSPGVAQPVVAAASTPVVRSDPRPLARRRRRGGLRRAPAFPKTRRIRPPPGPVAALAPASRVQVLRTSGLI